MDASLADAIAGDLREQRHARRQVSRVGAAVWYWRAALGMIVYFSLRALSASLARPRAGLEWRSVWVEAAQALRALRRTPAATSVIVATLALGLGVNAAIFSLVHGVLFAPLPFDRARI